MAAEDVDTHDPAGMAAFLRSRAQASREFLKLTDEQQRRQFLESWQRNVLPHFAFRFEQAAEMIERREIAIDELRIYRDELVSERDRLRAAFAELGQHVFGGGWLDHAATCNGEHCSCGLRDWLKRFESALDIQLDTTPDNVPERLPLSVRATCKVCGYSGSGRDGTVEIHCSRPGCPGASSVTRG